MFLPGAGGILSFMMKILPTFSAILLFLFSPWALRAGEDPPSLERAVRSALERAGGNAGEIRAFLDGLRGERLLAGRFLVAYMPVVDLASMDAASLRENLDLAFRARSEFPWGKRVTFPLFLHYVLPHRFAQEAFQRWRPVFFASMKRLLAGCTSMRDAVRAANAWCARRVKFIQTEWRDQTPLDTLKSGYGRCEEMMEVSMAALRAAGIPARPCSAPWWVVHDNNHAWVEVWVDGAWHFIGGCEDTPLDRTWFRKPARRAGLVVSVMYGSPREFDPGDRVYKILPDAALINSTAVYTSAGLLEVRLADRNGEALGGFPFAVSVFNFGGLRSLTTRKVGPGGRASVVLGPGEFFLSAGKDSLRAFRVVRVRPGKTTEVELRLREGAVPPGAFRLRYPTQAEADRLAAARDSCRETGSSRFRPRITKPALDLYERGKDPALDALLEGFPGGKELEKILADGRGNWREIGKGLKALGRDLLGPALAFLERTAHLDRVEMTPEILEDHVRSALEVRRKDTPDPIFDGWVLNGRIDLENLGPWRRRLLDEWAGMLSWEADDIARTLARWSRRELAPYARGRFGPFMNPGQVLVSRRATGRERAVFLVGALRSLGVPARKRPNQDVVEYWAGGRWKALSSGGRTVPAGGGVGLVPVTLFLRKGGKPFFSSRAVAFSRFTGGRWNPLRRLSFHASGGRTWVNLPPGDYLFTGGTRNSNGDPWVQCVALHLETGAPAAVGLALDFPSLGGIYKLPVCRKLDRLPVLKAGGSVLDLAGASRKGPLLLFVFLPSHEPSTRALSAFLRVYPALAGAGVKVVGLALPGPGGGKVRDLPFPVRRAGWEAARALGIPRPPGASDRLPSVLLLGKGGRPLLWVEGYETKLESMLREAARLVRR